MGARRGVCAHALGGVNPGSVRRSFPCARLFSHKSAEFVSKNISKKLRKNDAANCFSCGKRTRAVVYSLAIVLALAMVLCMIPAAFADLNETVSDKSYTLTVYPVDKDGAVVNSAFNRETNTNSITVKYNYEDLDEVTTGKFTEDKKVALVEVSGFNSNGKDLTDVEVTIDGKNLEVNELADYVGETGWMNNSQVNFPVELTKAGYTDTYLIEVTGKYEQNGETVNYKETAKITLKLENTAEYKNAKTATISKIESKDREMDAYIVGSKIYLDFVTSSARDMEDAVEITFKDNNGDLFDAVTWAYQPSSKESDKGAVFAIDEQKLDDSKATYDVNARYCKGTDGYFQEVVFKLETGSSIYETKEYDVVVRTGIVEADPKGIYFAESTKTIKIGEEYTPVVMGVATNKKVDADILPGTGTDRQVIDIDDNVVIGTQEGVAYITASYKPAGVDQTYTSNSMKITVTAGNVDDDDDTTTDGKTYMVTASSLRVRSGAGTNFSQIGSLKNGATVKVESIANGWAKLENGGYVSAQYLAEVVDNGEAQTMYVTARTLNVRKGPGTSYAKVGTLSRGTAVQVVGFSGNWAKLSNGYYVSTSYLAK